MAVEQTSDHDSDAWNHYSYVVSSRYREVTISRLGDGPATPSQVAGSRDVRITHVSRALRELRDRGLVDLLVDDDRKKGRVYGLNETGEEIASMLDEMTDEPDEDTSSAGGSWVFQCAECGQIWADPHSPVKAHYCDNEDEEPSEVVVVEQPESGS